MNPNKRVAELIDAAVRTPDQARQIVARHPEVLVQRWRLGETALHFVCIERFADAVRLLVELGADPNLPNAFGDSPLIDVAKLGYAEIAAILLQVGADPNATSDTHDNVLHCAISSGNAELVAMLLKAGADPNAKSTTHDNVLHYAVATGQAEAVGLLLRAGAVTDYVTSCDETILDAVPWDPSQSTAVLAVLCQHGIVRAPE